MEIVFIRHGHAKHNEAFAIEGESAYFSEKYLNAPLTDLGEAQTKSVTVPRVDRVYVSPLLRCIQTARNVFGSGELLYLHDGLLETQGQHPVNRRQPKTELFDYSPVNLDTVADSYVFVPETSEDVKIRTAKTLRSIISLSEGCKRIAIVTHHDWLFEALGVSFSNSQMKILYYDNLTDDKRSAISLSSSNISDILNKQVFNV